MDANPEKPKQTQCGTPKQPLWVRGLVGLGVLGLILGHVFLCLGPYGGLNIFEKGWPEHPPLLGKHPLHLYHSVLGAKGLLGRGSPTCIDPFFHAGYPKTPVFDSDSRFPERVLAICWRIFPPAQGKKDFESVTEPEKTGKMVEIVPVTKGKDGDSAVSNLAVSPLPQFGLPKPPQPSSPAPKISWTAPLWINPEEFTSASRIYMAQNLVCALLVPLILLGMSWSLKRNAPTALCLLFLGLIFWWSPVARDVDRQGNGVWLYGGLLLALCHALLVRYHQGPSLLTWACWSGAGTLLVLIQPIYVILAIPFFLGYTMRVGPRHPWIWQVGLITGALLPLLVHMDWLDDWVRYWWIRRAASLEISQSGAAWVEDWRQLVRPWEPTTVFPLALIALLFMAGWAQLHIRGARALGRSFGGAVFGLLAWVGIGFLWEPARRLETEGMFFGAVWFALYPAGVGLLSAMTGRWTDLDRSRSGICLLKAIPGCIFVSLALVMAGPELWSPLWLMQNPDAENLAMRKRQQAILEGLARLPPGGGRILWEEGDVAARKKSEGHSPLLPLLTGRSFMGGLDSSGLIEHLGSGLVDGRLAGNPIEDIADRELSGYFTAFNIGWVVCLSEVSEKRLSEHPGAVREGNIGDRALFRIDRKPSFVLRGQADLISATPEGIVLGNLKPDEGQVVLSFHFHSHWEAIPARVGVEREMDSRDPIPLVRLTLDGPVSRVVLRYKRN